MLCWLSPAGMENFISPWVLLRRTARQVLNAEWPWQGCGAGEQTYCCTDTSHKTWCGPTHSWVGGVSRGYSCPVTNSNLNHEGGLQTCLFSPQKAEAVLFS